MALVLDFFLGMAPSKLWLLLWSLEVEDPLRLVPWSPVFAKMARHWLSVWLDEYMVNESLALSVSCGCCCPRIVRRTEGEMNDEQIVKVDRTVLW